MRRRRAARVLNAELTTILRRSAWNLARTWPKPKSASSVVVSQPQGSRRIRDTSMYGRNIGACEGQGERQYSRNSCSLCHHPPEQFLCTRCPCGLGFVSASNTKNLSVASSGTWAQQQRHLQWWRPAPDVTAAPISTAGAAAYSGESRALAFVRPPLWWCCKLRLRRPAGGTGARQATSPEQLP